MVSKTKSAPKSPQKKKTVTKPSKTSATKAVSKKTVAVKTKSKTAASKAPAKTKAVSPAKSAPKKASTAKTKSVAPAKTKAPAKKPSPAVKAKAAPSAKPKATTPKRVSKPKEFPELLLETALKVLDERKAEDIVSIDLRGRSSIADYAVIASGGSSRALGALAEYIREAFHKCGVKSLRIEGLSQGDWVLIDSGDILIHLFRPEVRSFYNLEDIWSAQSPRNTAP